MELSPADGFVIWLIICSFILLSFIIIYLEHHVYQATQDELYSFFEQERLVNCN